MITVNALVVGGSDPEGDATLARWFRTVVIRGPGAFVEIAEGHAEYGTAMRRKLLRELGVMALSARQ